MPLPTPLACREAYKPTALLYQKRSRQLLCVFWVAFASLFLSVTFRAPFVSALGIGGVLFFIAGLVFYLPRLRCPVCSVSLEDSPATCCPECGVAALKQPKFLGSPRCTACAKRLRRGRGGRRYKIRYCHGCGSHLHDRGL